MFRVVDALISRQLKRLVTREKGGSCSAMKVERGIVKLEDVLFSCPVIEEILEREMGHHLPIRFDMVGYRACSAVAVPTAHGV